MANLVKLYENSDIYVADIKKDCILGLVNIAKKYKGIQKIVLFGSSLEERCTEYSDIDVAVYVDCTVGYLFNRKWYFNFQNDIFELGNIQDYDFIPICINSKTGKGIMNSIEAGEIIYEGNKK